MTRVFRDISLWLIAILLVMATLRFQVESTRAAADTITANLAVNATISIACTDTVTMGAITGTGQSALATNAATCTIITNNSGGYSLVWQASAATMTDATADTIAAYTPGTPNTPETWSVAGAASEWGGHLGSTSTTVNTTTWGAADTYAGGKWLNINNAATFEIANRATETTAGGDSEITYFGAEVGASKFQPTGTYTVNVTMTATTQ